MKVKYVGANPIRHGDKLVETGDELDLPENEAAALVASGLFETIKKKAAKRVKKSKAPQTDGAE